MSTKQSVLVLVAYAAFMAGICYFAKGWIEKHVCCPGQNDPCYSVYGDKGSYNCTSSGFWPDYCRVDGELVEM